MTGTIDVRRLIRIATVLLCIVTACLVYASFAPEVDAVSARVDNAEIQLDSDRNTLYRLDALRRERKALSNRYDRLFAQNPEAAFLRELSSDVARHGLTLVSTSEAHDTLAQNDGDQTALDVEIRGRYRALLVAVGELSLGPELVRVGVPSLRRNGSVVTATVPVTIFEPTATSHAQSSAP